MTTKSRGKRGKQIIRHGAFSYLTRLTLPDNRAYLRPHLSAVREGLIHDLGPAEEDLTTAQKLLIDRIIGQAGVIRLIEEHVREEGVFHGRMLTSVLAQNYLSFVNSMRLNLQALGINARAGAKMLGPLEIAAEIDAENAEREARDAEKRAESPVEARSPVGTPDTTDNSGDDPGGEIDKKGGKDNG